MDIQSKTEHNSNLFRHAYDDKFQLWQDHIVFSWRWWLGIVIVLLCLGIWFLLTRNRSRSRFIFAGLVSGIIATGLDLIGVFFGLWDYRYDLFPPVNTYLPWDMLVIPTLILVLLRLKPRINPFLKALLFAAIGSFVGLPLLHWLELYVPLDWSYFYSFPILFIIYLIADFMSKRHTFAPLQEEEQRIT